MLDEREKQAEVERSCWDKAHLNLLPAPVVASESSDLTAEDQQRAAAVDLDQPALRTGRWGSDEKLLFLYGLKRFGKGRWKKMSIYLPHRSLVQIKSHAQKVLKRQEAGDDIFRKLEDTSKSIIDRLVVQAAREREALRVAGINVNTTKPCKSLIAAAKKISQKQHQPQTTSTKKGNTAKKTTSPQEPLPELQHPNVAPPATACEQSSVLEPFEGPESGPESVIAAAALCQLSSVGGQWDQTADLSSENSENRHAAV